MNTPTPSPTFNPEYDWNPADDVHFEVCECELDLLCGLHDNGGPTPIETLNDWATNGR